jgi:hypothetical protein
VTCSAYSVKFRASVLCCDERERLTSIYLDATEANHKASESVDDIYSPEWREATKQTRQTCEIALALLKIHMWDHKCDRPVKPRPS